MPLLIGTVSRSTPAWNQTKKKCPPCSSNTNKNTKVSWDPLVCLPKQPDQIWLHPTHSFLLIPTNHHTVTPVLQFMCFTTSIPQSIMVLPSHPTRWYHFTHICCSHTAPTPKHMWMQSRQSLAVTTALPPTVTHAGGCKLGRPSKQEYSSPYSNFDLWVGQFCFAWVVDLSLGKPIVKIGHPSARVKWRYGPRTWDPNSQWTLATLS